MLQFQGALQYRMGRCSTLYAATQERTAGCTWYLFSTNLIPSETIYFSISYISGNTRHKLIISSPILWWSKTKQLTKLWVLLAIDFRFSIFAVKISQQLLTMPNIQFSHPGVRLVRLLFCHYLAPEFEQCRDFWSLSQDSPVPHFIPQTFSTVTAPSRVVACMPLVQGAGVRYPAWSKIFILKF